MPVSSARNSDTFTVTTPSDHEIRMTRLFDAPRDRVFKAWTDQTELKKWWGPKGFKVLHSTVDLRPGGMFLYGMESPTGEPMWGKFVYREITPPSRIVFVNSFSDEAGGVTRHPMAPNWPLEMLSVFTFETEGGTARFTVKWSPLNATDEEKAAFAAGHGSMQQGWSGTLEQLEAYLAKAV